MSSLEEGHLLGATASKRSSPRAVNKVSGLSLLSNAVMVWNSVHLAEIVGGLERC